MGLVLDRKLRFDKSAAVARPSASFPEDLLAAKLSVYPDRNFDLISVLGDRAFR